MGITVFTGCEETTAQNLIYETITPIKTLDPQTLSGETDLQVAHSIYRGLMRFDSGGNIVPDIASDYKISNNNKTYHFNIYFLYFHLDIPITLIICQDISKVFETRFSTAIRYVPLFKGKLKYSSKLISRCSASIEGNIKPKEFQ